MIRVIDDSKVIEEAISKALEKSESIDQLYEFIRGLFILEELMPIDAENLSRKINDRSPELANLLKLAAPLFNHLIEIEAPSKFGYIQCASLISIIKRGELEKSLFKEFCDNKEEALKKLAEAQDRENIRLRSKYEVPLPKG